MNPPFAIYNPERCGISTNNTLQKAVEQYRMVTARRWSESVDVEVCVVGDEEIANK